MHLPSFRDSGVWQWRNRWSPGRPRAPIDLGHAAFAVVLASALYVFAVNQTNAEATWQTSFSVPVDVVNVPAGLVATDHLPAVHLRLRATPQTFGGLQPGSFTAQIDGSHAQAGDTQLPVLVRSADPAVSDVTAEPPQLYVHLEPVLRRVIPIRVQLSGQVPVGYQLGQPGANPDHLTVTGPASLVDQAVQTLVDVSVQGVTVGVNGISTPLVVDASGTALTTTGLGLTPPAVSVDVPISQLTQHKAVGVQPVTHGAQGPGYVVQPLEVDPATVTLVGSAAGLASVNFVQTQSIDITGIASTVVRQVALAPPSGTLLLQPNQTVNVTIRVTPLTTTQTLRVTPSAINVPSGLVVTNTPVPVALTISGPAPTLATLSSADIRDVTGKGPGQYRISPQVRNLPQGMSLPRTEPGPVEVDLAATPNGAG